MPESIPAWWAGLTAVELWAGLSLGELWGWLLALSAVAVAVWKGWPTIRKVVAAAGQAVALVDTLATLPADLEAIKHELHPNSGKSVKDIATRTEAAVAQLAGELATVRGEVANVSGEVAHVRRQAASLKTSMTRTNRRLTEHIKTSAIDPLAPADSGGFLVKGQHPA